MNNFNFELLKSVVLKLYSSATSQERNLKERYQAIKFTNFHSHISKKKKIKRGHNLEYSTLEFVWNLKAGGWGDWSAQLNRNMAKDESLNYFLQ